MKSIQPDTGVTVTLTSRRSGMAQPPSHGIVVKPAIELGPESGQGHGRPQDAHPQSLLSSLVAAEGPRRRLRGLSLLEGAPIGRG